MNIQTDPLQSITLALRSRFLAFGVNETILGYPDPKELDMDGKLPMVGLMSISETAKHEASREATHAIAGGGTRRYTELLRMTYLIQLSLFATTPEDRSDLGWKIKHDLVSAIRIPIGTLGLADNGEPIETAMFKYRHEHDDIGSNRVFKRDLTFEVTARMLDAEDAYVLLYPTFNVSLNDERE